MSDKTFTTTSGMSLSHADIEQRAEDRRDRLRPRSTDASTSSRTRDRRGSRRRPRHLARPRVARHREARATEDQTTTGDIIREAGPASTPPEARSWRTEFGRTER